MNRKLALILVSLSFILSPIYIYSSIIYTQENVNSFNPDIAVVLGSGTAGVSEIGVNGTSAIVNVTAAETHNFVDNNVSDVDTSADKGSHSNFTAQRYADNIYDTLTEGGTTTGNGSEWLSCNVYTDEQEVWEQWGDNQGSGNFLSTIGDGNVLQEHSTGYQASYWYGFPDTTLSGTITANISIYGKNDDGAGDDHADVIVDYIGGEGSELGSACQHTGYSYDTFSIGNLTVAEANAIRLKLQYDKSGQGDDVYVDYARVGFSSSGTTTYETDLEVQWTNVDYDESSEELCINGGTMGAENITVDTWNGSDWENVFTHLTSGWNNVSVSAHLTSANFTIRFKGDTETGDTDQDMWDIDVSLLHVWTHTYDYILNVTSQKAYDQNITLNLYNYTNIDRLSNCTIWFRDGATSVQINITDGIVVQDVGPWYLLPASETRYIGVHVEESSSGTSNLFIKLEAVKASSIVYTCLIKLTVK